MASSDPTHWVAVYQPAIPREIVASVKAGQYQNPKWLYGPVNDSGLWQGDIIPNIKLSWVDKTAQIQSYQGAAILLSHGCDADPDRDIVITFAPIFPIDVYIKLLQSRTPSLQVDQRVQNIRNNKLTNLFFLPSVGTYSDSVADFSFAAAVSTQYAKEMVAGVDSCDRLRLSHGGWYLFTAMLTRHVAHLESVKDYPRAGRFYC